jgi:chemotaxis protein methyltransferase CheR
LRGRGRRIRIWSAACSTGEEPFSLAMLLARHFSPTAGWEGSVLATDLSTRALAVARTATWSIDKSNDIPPPLLKRYMMRGTDEQLGKMRAKPSLRALVHFEALNLASEPYGVGGPFDLIFCRNVLIYFQAAHKARVIQALLGHLAPGGHLVLGHAETVTGLGDQLQNVAPNIYRKR